jgi:hypothetical protein
MAQRGKSGNSGTVWAIGALGGIVLIIDLVAGVRWLVRGRPASPIHVFAAVVLVLSTLLLCGTAVLAVSGVRRQRYAMNDHGLAIPWRTRRLDLHLPWTEIQAIGRRYDKAIGGGTVGVAVFVVNPERFLKARWAWWGSPARRAQEHQRTYGSPIYLDLTDIDGGTMRFLAAARWYADRDGRTTKT